MATGLPLIPDIDSIVLIDYYFNIVTLLYCDSYYFALLSIQSPYLVCIRESVPTYNNTFHNSFQSFVGSKL